MDADVPCERREPNQVQEQDSEDDDTHSAHAGDRWKQSIERLAGGGGGRTQRHENEKKAKDEKRRVEHARGQERDQSREKRKGQRNTRGVHGRSAKRSSG